MILKFAFSAYLWDFACSTALAVARVLRPGNPIPVPLVSSPATRLQKKKKRHLWGKASEHNLSTLEIMLASTDAMETGRALGKPLKPESR